MVKVSRVVKRCLSLRILTRLMTSIGGERSPCIHSPTCYRWKDIRSRFTWTSKFSSCSQCPGSLGRGMIESLWYKLLWWTGRWRVSPPSLTPRVVPCPEEELLTIGCYIPFWPVNESLNDNPRSETETESWKEPLCTLSKTGGQRVETFSLLINSDERSCDYL